MSFRNFGTTMRTLATGVAIAAAAVTAPPPAAAYRGYPGYPFRHHRPNLLRPGFLRPGFLHAPAPVPDRDGSATVATRMSPSFVQLGLGRGGFGPARADGHFHRYGVFGWVGPLFWPYAWNDINCSVFWSYWGWGCGDSHWSAGYGEPFWDYGPGDLARALFTPFGFDDLAPYLPNGVSSVRRARASEATANDLVAQMCGDASTAIAAWPVERIATLVTLDDGQRAALAALSTAAVKAAQTVKDGCATAVAFTPGHRLDTMMQRLEAMQAATAVVAPALAGFYASLSDEQKAKFAAAAAASEPDEAARDALKEAAREAAANDACRTAGTVPPWPEARIAAVLQPTPAQAVKLKALQDALGSAATTLAASCPQEAALTPPARLDAVSKRLAAMLAAVAAVRPALDDLYDDLSDTQKAHFNRIARAEPGKA